jgi:hypothetical protein
VLPRFEVVARRRPIAVVGEEVAVGEVGAPYVAVESPLGTGAHEVEIAGGTDRLVGRWDGDGFALQVTASGRTTHHRSRRDGRPRRPPEAMALALTGEHLTVLSREAGTWVARGRANLGHRTRARRSGRSRRYAVPTRDETWLAGLSATGGRSGVFGQVGLRDLRLVTDVDGTAVRDGGVVLLSATSAGPGFFDTAHTSVWGLDPTTLDLGHRADLFFRRPDRPGVHGDHATHVVRDGARWLVATSTWGDFDPRRRGASVAVTLAETTADVTRGRHVLDTRPLPLPTTGLRSVGVWDPHLVHTGEQWLVAYVSASRFFRFHPVLATGPGLDDLTLRAALTDRRATEGPTLLHVDGRWLLGASDGRDNPAGLRERYPLLDLDLREVGTLDAAYPTNISWPTVVPVHPAGGDDLLLVGFDGTPTGGRLVGYGSHGDVVVQRTAPVPGPGAGSPVV